MEDMYVGERVSSLTITVAKFECKLLKHTDLVNTD